MTQQDTEVTMTDLKARLEAWLAERDDPHFLVRRDQFPEIIAALSAAERVRELEGALERVPAALHVLRGMCRTVGLPLGVKAADDMLTVVAAILAKQENPA